MALFDGKEQVLKIEGLSLGEFDPSVHGFYKNVKTFPFDVKKRRAIRVEIKADFPIDIAIANEKGSSLFHKQAVKEGSFGPVSTGDNKEMGIIVGVYPGDKATFSVEVWMVKA